MDIKDTITVNIPNKGQTTPINVAYAIIDKNKNIVPYNTLMNNLSTSSITEYMVPTFEIVDYTGTSTKPNIIINYTDESIQKIENGDGNNPVKYQLQITHGALLYNTSDTITCTFKAKCGSVYSSNKIKVVQNASNSGTITIS